MNQTSRAGKIEAFVRNCFKVVDGVTDRMRPSTIIWIEKAFAFLPEHAADLFLFGRRDLTVLLAADPGLPLGMKTTSEGPPDARRYVIMIFEELQEFPEDLFIGSFLRQLAQVVGEIPPEEEWPERRSERARMRERVENRADALVWHWGLKDQNLRFLQATYPPHIVADIIPAIEEALKAEQRSSQDSFEER